MPRKRALTLQQSFTFAMNCPIFRRSTRQPSFATSHVPACTALIMHLHVKLAPSSKSMHHAFPHVSNRDGIHNDDALTDGQHAPTTTRHYQRSNTVRAILRVCAAVAAGEHTISKQCAYFLRGFAHTFISARANVSLSCKPHI